MKKGQAAIETIIILSVSLIILMVVLFSGQDQLTKAERNFWESQIKTSLAKLADGADFVFSQSTGATTEVYITVPPSVNDIVVAPLSFEFVVTNQGETSNFIEVTSARLSGDIDASPGSKYVVLVNEGNHVSVSGR
jgi:hypothetical protein